MTECLIHRPAPATADLAQFVYRAANPTTVDLVCGTLLIALIFEATRRTVGWILPACAAGFLAYAWLGPVRDRVGLVSSRIVDTT